jgi:hypothetical protein
MLDKPGIDITGVSLHSSRRDYMTQRRDATSCIEIAISRLEAFDQNVECESIFQFSEWPAAYLEILLEFGNMVWRLTFPHPRFQFLKHWLEELFKKNHLCCNVLPIPGI